MDIPEFPPNSDASRKPKSEDKKIEPIVTSGVVVRKKSLGRKFRETFMQGNLKMATQYTLLDIAVPMIQDLFIDMVTGTIEKLVRGDSSRRYRSGGLYPPPSGPTGVVDYRSRFPMTSRWNSPQRTISRQARARHDFDEVVLGSRIEAEEVIERLYDLVDRYAGVSVADLYDVIGIPSTHVDHKWGWTNLQGAGVTRVPDGYLLDLPEPHPID